MRHAEESAHLKRNRTVPAERDDERAALRRDALHCLSKCRLVFEAFADRAFELFAVTLGDHARLPKCLAEGLAIGVDDDLWILSAKPCEESRVKVRWRARR